MSDNKKNINYTNNDGAKFRYSAYGDRKKAEEEKKTEKAEKKEKIKEALTKRAVFWKTNRVFALIVLIAVIILASVLSVHRAVSRSASPVEKYYNDAGIKSNVATVIECSKSLISLNKALDPDSATNAEASRLTDALDKEYSDPFWKDTELVKKLRYVSEDLYNNIAHNPSASEDDLSKSAESFGTLKNSYGRLGDSNNYKKAAENYNKVVSRFPASLTARQKAPVFEGGIGTIGGEGDAENSSGGIFGLIMSILSTIASKIAGLSVMQIVGIGVAIVLLIRFLVNQSGGKKRNG